MSIASYGDALSTEISVGADGAMTSGFGQGLAGLSTAMPAPVYTPSSTSATSDVPSNALPLSSVQPDVPSTVSGSSLNIWGSLQSAASNALYGGDESSMTTSSNGFGYMTATPATPLGTPGISRYPTFTPYPTVSGFWSSTDVIEPGLSPSPSPSTCSSSTPRPLLSSPSKAPWATASSQFPNGYAPVPILSSAAQTPTAGPYVPQYSLSPVVESIPLVLTGKSFTTTIGTRLVTINPNTMDIAVPTPTPGAYNPPIAGNGTMSGAANAQGTPTPYGTAQALSETSTGQGALVTAGVDPVGKGSELAIAVALAAAVGGLVL